MTTQDLNNYVLSIVSENKQSLKYRVVMGAHMS